jgi:hypothetical protein
MPANTSKVSTAAKARVRDRLRERPKEPITNSITAQIPASDSKTATTLANDLAVLIGVDVEHLRAGDRLRNILRVHTDELPENVRPLVPRVGLGDVVDPFAFSLLDFVEKRIGKDRSRMQRPAFMPRPKNEEQWIERILDMTVADFLTALA